MQKAFSALAAVLSICVSFGARAAVDLPVCAPGVAKGASCLIAAEDVRPTQMAFGELEVQARAAKLAAMSAAKLEDYLKAHVMPLVVGPGGKFYATDHHHLAIALARAHGVRAQVIAVILDDWRALDPALFWKRMLVAGRLYPFDETGSGPVTPARLPTSLFELRDDPWRSLAFGVQNAGGYRDDSGVPYADFLWADFLRTRVDGRQITDDFDAAVAKGVGLACAADARAMPGFSGPCSSF